MCLLVPASFSSFGIGLANPFLPFLAINDAKKNYVAPGTKALALMFVRKLSCSVVGVRSEAGPYFSTILGLIRRVIKQNKSAEWHLHPQTSLPTGHASLFGRIVTRYEKKKGQVFWPGFKGVASQHLLLLQSFKEWTNCESTVLDGTRLSPKQKVQSLKNMI